LIRCWVRVWATAGREGAAAGGRAVAAEGRGEERAVAEEEGLEVEGQVRFVWGVKDE
jgi:hypothetical protein